MRALERLQYRRQLRLARSYDTNPQLKFLLTAPPSGFYDRQTGNWTTLPEPPDSPHHLVATLLRNRSFYIPDPESFVSRARAAFRHSQSMKEEGGEPALASTGQVMSGEKAERSAALVDCQP
jgi:hypothetical protein